MFKTRKPRIVRLANPYWGGTPYGILNVDSNATPQQVGNAYLDIAKQVLLDSSYEPQFQEDLFQKINTAYVTLIDPEKRLLGDRQLEKLLKTFDMHNVLVYANGEPIHPIDSTRAFSKHF